MDVYDIKTKAKSRLSSVKNTKLKKSDAFRPKGLKSRGSSNRNKGSGSTISQIRNIPVLGFLIWWVYMILQTPEKINNLFKTLEESVARLSSEIAELQRRTAPISLEENVVIKAKPYYDAVSLPKDDISREDENALYLSFENVFRGSESEVCKRQENYASYSREAYEKTGKYFLDVGCGRGEFLKILNKYSVQAKGLDLNSLSCDNLKIQGFDVECVDVNTYLEGLCDNTLSGISAFQLIEHLKQDDLKKFIALALKKTAQDGVIIIETVNTKCISSSSNFYLDMSHKKPLPAELMKFLLEWYNFKDIQILYSSPCIEELRVKRLIEYNYMDYAVIGWKR